MVVKAKHIYRTEYFDAQKEGHGGCILITSSFNQHIFLFFSLLVLMLIIMFIVFAEYTRKETLVGVVSPQGGMIKVQANDSGYVEKIFVKVGQRVKSLSPLYEIKTERFDDSGVGVKKRILSSIERQYNLLVERRQQETKKNNFEHQSLIDKVSLLDAEIDVLNKVIALSNNELSITKQLFDKQMLLLNNKYLSEVDYQRQHLELLSKQSQLEVNILNLKKLQREKKNIVDELTNLNINLDITLKDLDRQLETMVQNKAEFLYQSDSQVRSPINGIVASILTQEGHSVVNGQPLLIIVPESDKAFVELFAPSRSIGFMKVGQKVKLRFDAFPYEKFGIQAGIITSVSKSAVAPEMIANRRLINDAESAGLYQIKVQLLKPTITVYGREERLVSGMAVVADVELDTRKIYEWILEPLYTIKGKI